MKIDAYLPFRGVEAVCRRLGLPNQAAKLHPHRFRHTAPAVVQDGLGGSRVTADYLGHHGLGFVAGYTEVSSSGAGSEISTRRPSASTAVLAVFHPAPSASAILATLTRHLLRRRLVLTHQRGQRPPHRASG